MEALRAGAFWYLEKPFDQGHLDVVRTLVDHAIELGRLKSENRILQKQLCSKLRLREHRRQQLRACAARSTW